jgi:hypothetical protein
MITWHYDGGQWTETTFEDDVLLPGPVPDDWPYDPLQGLGYEAIVHAGDERTFHLQLWHSEKASPACILLISDINWCGTITAARLPDGLDLAARYAPIVTAASALGAVMGDIYEGRPAGGPR